MSCLSCDSCCNTSCNTSCNSCCNTGCNTSCNSCCNANCNSCCNESNLYKGDVIQVAENKFKVIFHRHVSEEYITNPYNVWIRSNDLIPSGIATVGLNQCVTENNSLTPRKVTISKIHGSEHEYLFTFKCNITAGTRYAVIVMPRDHHHKCTCEKDDYSVVGTFTGSNCFRNHLCFPQNIFSTTISVT